MSKTIIGADGAEYTILTDIKYNDETIWPEDFEPPVSKQALTFSTYQIPFLRERGYITRA